MSRKHIEAVTKWPPFCRRHFLNENFWILYEISLKYVPYGLIDNIMAWRRTGDGPSSEPMLVSFTGAYIYTSLGHNVWDIHQKNMNAGVMMTLHVVSEVQE